MSRTRDAAALPSFTSANGNATIDHGAEAVHRNCTVHGLEIDPTSDADRTERNSAAGQQ